MPFPILKKTAALLALAVLASCGGGGGAPQTRVTAVADDQLLEGDSGAVALRFVLTMENLPSTATSIRWSTGPTDKGFTGSATGGRRCGPGGDYISVDRVQAIPLGATRAELQVTVCSDTEFEPTETVAVNWVSGDGSGTAIGTIVNDDAGGLNGTGLAASFGRDSNPLTNSNADGRLGFSFAQVPGAADPRCVRDNVTGLLWEAKSAGGGLHDATRTFTYAELAGQVAAVNTEALCGATDWRLPTPQELSSLVDAGAASAPTIDHGFFPNQRPTPYWTSTTYHDGVGQDAWYVDFATGTVAMDNKARAFAVRLVSSGGTPAPAPLPTSCSDARRFIDHGDGTVTDQRTGLMWKRCEEGLAGARCTGTAAVFDWSAALAQPAAVNADAAARLGYGDWRLPTRAELSSIAEREQCFNPAAIAAAFPGTTPTGFWTSTPYAFNAALGWAVDFFDGQVAPAVKAGVGSSSKRVRLVRAGQ